VRRGQPDGELAQAASTRTIVAGRNERRVVDQLALRRLESS